MQLNNIFRSYSFRLVLFGICLFAASGIAILAFVYWRTSTVIVQELDDSLREEAFELTQRFRDGGVSALVKEIDLRSAGPSIVSPSLMTSP